MEAGQARLVPRQGTLTPPPPQKGLQLSAFKNLVGRASFSSSIEGDCFR